MATIKVFTFSANPGATSDSGTIYTCPADTIAKVTPIRASIFVNAQTSSSASISIGGGYLSGAFNSSYSSGYGNITIAKTSNGSRVMSWSYSPGNSGQYGTYIADTAYNANLLWQENVIDEFYLLPAQTISYSANIYGQASGNFLIIEEPQGT